MIAFIIIIYTAVILVLFKVLRIRPTAFLAAGILVAGVLWLLRTLAHTSVIP
jgi:membrane fusion protein (multidrug efflux system)